MIKIKRYKKGILLFICITYLSSLVMGCNNQKQHQNNKFGDIYKNNITSFKVHNIQDEEKEIQNKSDRDKLIDLINSVKITKTGVEPRLGVGFGIIITYSDGEKISASFLATTMAYLSGNKSIWCDIDKNIVDDLRFYYDKN